MNLTLHSFVSIWITMAGMSEEDGTRTAIDDRCQYAANGTKRNQRWNLSCNSSVCKGQQQAHERLLHKQRIVTSHVLRCQHFLWMDNVRKVTRWWFRMEIMQVYV